MDSGTGLLLSHGNFVDCVGEIPHNIEILPHRKVFDVFFWRSCEVERRWDCLWGERALVHLGECLSWALAYWDTWAAPQICLPLGQPVPLWTLIQNFCHPTVPRGLGGYLSYSRKLRQVIHEAPARTRWLGYLARPSRYV